MTPTVRLLRPIGQGGMGKVWVAQHTGLKTEVVVKFMSTDVAKSSDAAARFEREASVAAAVKSPHVVQTFDYGLTSDGVPYIVMEKLEGQDLAEHIHEHGKMPPHDVAVLVAQVAKALGKAHQVGVIHRDIKPDNIFLCEGEAGELFVKLLDFGIAKSAQRVENASTVTGQVVGTPFYMSPEQIVGDQAIDARTDIWSLGVVAFEALTGRRPFDGATVGAITLALHTTKPRVSALLPGAPPGLDAWFAKVCAHAPTARFQTAREAAHALFAAIGETSDPGLMRPGMASIVEPTESEPHIRVASSNRAPEPVPSSGPERAVTHLSSAFHVTRAPRKPPVLAFAIAAVAVLGLAGAAFVAMRKPAASPANAVVPPVATIPPTAPIALTVTTAAATTEPAPSAEPAATTAPSAPSASASAQKPKGLPGNAAAKPGTRPTTTATTRPVKKRDDDDIK